jgi:hypothetical protein
VYLFDRDAHGLIDRRGSLESASRGVRDGARVIALPINFFSRAVARGVARRWQRSPA